MALISLTNENVFVGATIFRGETKLHVYKVNAKSLYVGEQTNKSIQQKWETRGVGIKWIGFMDRNDGKKVSFDGLKISSEEANRKSGFMKVQEAKGAMRDWLGVKGRQLLEELLEKERKGKNVMMMENRYGSKSFNIIVIHPERNGQVLIRLGNAYLFFNVNTQVYTRFDKSIHKDGKKVVFPELIMEQELVAV